MIDTPSPVKPATTSAAATDPIQSLRAATHALHQQLDHNLPLARPDAGLPDYTSHLCILRDWQVALAPWLARTNASDPSVALITADLVDCAAAGIAVPKPQDINLAGVTAVDDGSDAFGWGIAYVLEGSRLGGQVLFRRLQQQLAPHPLRYLGERGADGMPWPQFLAGLRQKLGEPAALDAGCKGAVAAFESLLTHFRRQGALA
ncbi:MAG: biliverdin-producing heme oxygenase [Pseudomonadota bacterium]